MSDIISLVERKRRDALHNTDSYTVIDAQCADCGHEWEATAPKGATSLECPECHVHTGLVYGCTGCGSDTFNLCIDGAIFCAECGNELLFTDD